MDFNNFMRDTETTEVSEPVIDAAPIAPPNQAFTSFMENTMAEAPTLNEPGTTPVDTLPTSNDFIEHPKQTEEVYQQELQAKAEALSADEVAADKLANPWKYTPAAIEFESQLEANAGDVTLDPLTLALETPVAKGVFKLGGAMVNAARWPKHMLKIFESKTPQQYKEMQNTQTFMEEHGILPSNFLIEGSTSSDTRQFLTGSNVFAVREAFESQSVLTDKYFKSMDGILGKLKANKIDPNNIKTWRDTKQAEVIISGEVQKLRAEYKVLENDAFGKVQELAKANKSEYKISDFSKQLFKDLKDDGVPDESANVVNNIMNRFKKPYKDEAAKLTVLGKENSKMLVEAKRLKALQKTAIKDGDIAKAEKLEGQMAANKAKMKDNLNSRNALKDTKFMTVTDGLNTIKLINRKIYKPGGAISIKDADELRGLHIAKGKLEDFLAKNVDEVKNPELFKAIRKAKDLTIARTALFGAKDSGGEKLMLAKLLDKGEYGKVTEYLTGKNAKENVTYIRDTFGKESEAYKSSFSLYLHDKLGMTPGKLPGILDESKAFSQTGKIDINKVATKMQALDGQDFAMVKDMLGEKAMLDMKSMRQLVMNFSDLEIASQKYGRGITSGKLAYIAGEEKNPLSMIGRGLKLVKDAIGFHVGKTTSKVIGNQPRFRTLTGAATGNIAYVIGTDKEDITLEGMIASLVIGGTAGYGMGKVARAAFESDAAKVARYLKRGTGHPDGMPKQIQQAMYRLGEQAKKLEDDAMQGVTKAVAKPGEQVPKLEASVGIGAAIIGSQANSDASYVQGKDFNTLGELANKTNNTVEDIKAQNPDLGVLQPGQKLESSYSAKDQSIAKDKYSETDLMELDVEAVEEYFSKRESKSTGGYKAKNPDSSAKGKYQLIDSTRREQAKKLGIDFKDSLIPENQEKIFVSLIKEYSELLSDTGIEKTPNKLYAVHQLGRGRFKRYANDTLTSKDIITMRDNLPPSKRKGGKQQIIAAWKSIYDAEEPTN